MYRRRFKDVRVSSYLVRRNVLVKFAENEHFQDKPAKVQLLDCIRTSPLRQFCDPRIENSYPSQNAKGLRHRESTFQKSLHDTKAQLNYQEYARQNRGRYS